MKFVIKFFQDWIQIFRQRRLAALAPTLIKLHYQYPQERDWAPEHVRKAGGRRYLLRKDLDWMAKKGWVMPVERRRYRRCDQFYSLTSTGLTELSRVSKVTRLGRARLRTAT